MYKLKISIVNKNINVFVCIFEIFISYNIQNKKTTFQQISENCLCIKIPEKVLTKNVEYNIY